MGRGWLPVLGVSAGALLLCGCVQLGFLAVNTAASFSTYSRQSNLAYGPLPANHLDLYRPIHAVDAPVVVFFHGGGWNSGDKADYKFVGAALAASGIIAVIPDYQLYPAARFPAFMHDAAGAVAWTRRHAREWGGDPAQLYLVGHSSGAHIAVLLALDPQYLQQLGGTSAWLRGVVGLAGPYDFLPFTDAYLNDVFGPPADFPRSQPINYVRSDAPPLLLMAGLADQTVSPHNTRSLAAAMQRVGGKVTTVYFPHAGHAALVASFSSLEPGRVPVLPQIRAFIAAHSAVP